MLAPGNPIHVRKLKPDGKLDYAWDGAVLRCDDAGIVLRAEFNVDLVERDFAIFRRGDVFVEFYWWDRWFNVFQISEPDGALKGWYANVGQPAELSAGDGDMHYVDLALDVWTWPSGEFVVLDQDEFDELIDQRRDLATGAERGRQALMELVTSRQLPRWPE
jgi:protein associated with RNAse G/E